MSTYKPTLQMISESKRENRSFWNAQLKMYIAFYREALRTGRKTWYLDCIQKSLVSRNNYEYYCSSAADIGRAMP